jgi:hypothetical protein
VGLTEETVTLNFVGAAVAHESGCFSNLQQPQWGFRDRGEWQLRAVFERDVLAASALWGGRVEEAALAASIGKGKELHRQLGYIRNWSNYK